MEVMSSAKAKQVYGGEIEQLEAKYGGGSVITKMQNNGSGSKSGPYAWFIAPPSGGRKWHYLGPVEESSGAGVVGNSGDTSNLDFEEAGHSVLSELIDDSYSQISINEVQYEYRGTNLELRFEYETPRGEEGVIETQFDLDDTDLERVMGGVDIDLDKTRGSPERLKTIPTEVIQNLSRSNLEYGYFEEIAIPGYSNDNGFKSPSQGSEIGLSTIRDGEYGKKAVVEINYEDKEDLKDLEWDKAHPSYNEEGIFGGGDGVWMVDLDSLDYVSKNMEDKGYTVNKSGLIKKFEDDNEIDAIQLYVGD